jgi:hypothetical protein
MRPQDPHNRPSQRRSCRPTFEGLESRAVLSSHPIGAPFPGKHVPVADVQQFVPVLYPPGTPQPTPAEIQRESFVNKAVGRYTIGPGRFDTQAISIHGAGKKSTSNVSLTTRFQYLIFEPTDPSKPVIGAMNIMARNITFSGSNVILDLQGPTGTEVNGLPTHLYWVNDLGSGATFTGTGITFPGSGNFPGNYINSQGAPANPAPGTPGGGAPSSINNWNMGFGDITFQYIPDRHPLPGTLGSGRVIVVTRGLLNTSGAQSTIDKNYQ